MKQVLIKKDRASVEEVPVSMVSDNTVLVQVAYSSISAGTEMASIKSSGEPIIKKIINHPEIISKGIDHFKREGLLKTIQKVQGKSEQGRPSGYSAAGIVVEVGSKIKDINIGDRVACAGAGIANHAEYIEVPRNLLVKIPDEVNFNLASTVTLGAIAMQGIRRSDAKLGEYVAVIGLGILGQLTAQMLKANGIRTIGIDLDESRVQIALKCGCDFGINPTNEDPVKKVIALSNGYGVDRVIITASSSSKKPLAQAFQMCRKKGRVVLVGVVGMEIDREDMYKKELDFLISTSYGPGRYDENYESKGQDYPYSYVRWTENRNMEEYLRLIADKKIDVNSLIKREYKIEEAPIAYEELKTAENKPLIILLKYDQEKEKQIIRKIEVQSKPLKKSGKINIALIGAGGFAKGMHLPNLMRLKDVYNLHAIASRTGSNAKSIAQKFEAKYATTDYKEILKDNEVDAVIIATRHNLHAKIAIEALKSGKAVLLEKPMALNQAELDELVKTIYETKRPFMVGFNRRFSPYAQEVKRHISQRINPMIINYQMNAGYIPLDHWVHTEEGGGRIIGEACHIFDLFNYFTDEEIESVTTNRITPKTDYIKANDNAVVTIKYKDGSVCTLTYTALGNNQYPKEFCQIYFDEKIIIIDDYKELKGFGIRVKKIKTNDANKGQYEELAEFAKSIKGEIKMPIPLWQLRQSTEISFRVETTSK